MLKKIFPTINNLQRRYFQADQEVLVWIRYIWIKNFRQIPLNIECGFIFDSLKWVTDYNIFIQDYQMSSQFLFTISLLLLILGTQTSIQLILPQIYPQ